MKRLKILKIGTRPFFFPMHKQPVFEEMGIFENQSYPVSENLYQQGLYLPSGLTLTEENIQKVSSKLRSIIL